MKKLLMILGIIFVLAISILCFETFKLPRKVPIPLIKYNNLEIKVIPSTYAWFNKDKGGNSVLGLPPEESVKSIQPVIVESNGKVSFSFDVFLKPKDISLILWRNGKIISEKTLKGTKEGFFYAPNETGIYVYEINGQWDETHTSSFSFKIEVKN